MTGHATYVSPHLFVIKTMHTTSPNYPACSLCSAHVGHCVTCSPWQKQAAAADLTNTYLGWSRESHFVYAHVRSNRSSCCWSISWQNIDDSRWKPGLSKQYDRKQALAEMTAEPSKTAGGVGGIQTRPNLPVTRKQGEHHREEGHRQIVSRKRRSLGGHTGNKSGCEHLHLHITEWDWIVMWACIVPVLFNLHTCLFLFCPDGSEDWIWKAGKYLHSCTLQRTAPRLPHTTGLKWKTHLLVFLIILSVDSTLFAELRVLQWDNTLDLLFGMSALSCELSAFILRQTSG